jgi:hypothetical protein
LLVLEFLPDERRANLVIAEDCAVLAFGTFVEFDAKILDERGLELFGHALLHVARGLPDFQLPGVRFVVD